MLQALTFVGVKQEQETSLSKKLEVAETSSCPPHTHIHQTAEQFQTSASKTLSFVYCRNLCLTVNVLQCQLVTVDQQRHSGCWRCGQRAHDGSRAEVVLSQRLCHWRQVSNDRRITLLHCWRCHDLHSARWRCVQIWRQLSYRLSWLHGPVLLQLYRCVDTRNFLKCSKSSIFVFDVKLCCCF